MLRDATVFEDEHLPREIVGRNSQMNEVTDALTPVEDGARAENCFLFGPSGAGKTTVARAAVRELRREVLDVPTAYVNCWKDYTRRSVLERAANDLANAAVPKNAPARDLIDTLQNGLDSPSVIILDEVDQLQDPDTLYDLHSVPGLAWICIANREVDLLARLDERVHSRVSVGYRVQFDRYTVDTVTEILERRTTQGLEPGAVESGTLERIAELVDGDARQAITALRVAARKSEREGLSTIPRRLVDDAVHDAEAAVRRKTISKLNDHQRVLYERIEAAGPLIQKELYAEYEETHPDPITLRALRESHLPKLEHYNLIETERGGDGKRYRLASSAR
ncbi:Cdc6/Cdc18 family protein [Halolamina salifodinae]|uniref:Cdc6-like AAA superfamily ATPase n=1 Tax=Halolamina salifodinae TaxID=1202767 RepID=A0A8T4GUB7_9EURY|nr:Cdc6/Cdc18 family protein [Halolamina salifodinae]MBP1986637.1 Cdc6-like AAA superfamily ATPase [Halolamina salifodinae]